MGFGHHIGLPTRTPQLKRKVDGFTFIRKTYSSNFLGWKIVGPDGREFFSNLPDTNLALAVIKYRDYGDESVLPVLQASGLKEEYWKKKVGSESVRRILLESSSPGKRVGSRIYIHRDYAGQVVDPQKIEDAKQTAEKAGYDMEDYTAIRYDTGDGSIAFQWSPDFDTADEPTVGDTVTVRPDGKVSRVPGAFDPWIWHHKWMWVGDDYQGFDVAASKARSQLWQSHVSAAEKSKIGKKSYWDRIRERWEKP